MLTIPFAVFVVSSILIMVVFGAVAGSTGTSGTPRLRQDESFPFIVLCVADGRSSHLPRADAAAASVPDSRRVTPDRVVHAVGKQYAWSLTDGPGPSLATWDRDFSPTVTVPAGTMVEFRVTTLDVNHGFSLYAPDGHLVAQTQAMPGYVNRLRVTFDRARHVHRALSRILRHEPSPDARSRRGQVRRGGAADVASHGRRRCLYARGSRG